MIRKLGGKIREGGAGKIRKHRQDQKFGEKVAHNLNISQLILSSLTRSQDQTNTPPRQINFDRA